MPRLVLWNLWLPGAVLVASLVAALLLAGCTGFSTKSERQSRADLKAVTAGYRPDGGKPPLPVLTPESGLSNYLEYAMMNQPRVEVAYYEWAASVERITTARSLPDPQLSFQMDIQSAVTSVMPGLMAAIPWPAKLRVGADLASAESRARFFAFQSAVLASAFEVKRAYYQLYFLEEKLAVNRETLRLLGELEATARAQNEVGKVTLQDVLRAQIEQARLRTEIANLEHSRDSLLTQFKAALGMKPEEPPPPLPLQFTATPLDLTPDQLLAAALAANQQIKGLEAGVRAAEASILLARKGRYPDFTVGVMADVKADPTVYRVPGDPATMTLPIWRDKIAAQIAEAQANKQAAEARLTDEQIALAVAVAEKSHLYYEATSKLALLNDELLPMARRSLEVAQSGYLAGQIDFFNLTDSQRTLLGFKLDRVEASTQREIVLAELSLIIQGMPPAGGTGATGSTGMNGAGQPTLKPARPGGI